MILKIFDVELELDVTDVLFLETFEDEMERLKVQDEKLGELEKKSQQLKAYCEAIFTMFDNLFGEGTADKLFKGKYNIFKCDEAFDLLITGMNTAAVNHLKLNKNRLKKYDKFIVDLKKL